MSQNKVLDALLGVAVGDALGVPFEFRSADEMKQNPATKMIGYGTYNQLPGTWSDDSSLTFCLAESLINGYSLKDMAQKFIAWRDANYWSPRGVLFDIGVTTRVSISELKEILENGTFEKFKNLKYLGDEYDNGNGSLMRIMPLLFYIKGKPIKEQFDLIWECSALTHKHIRAAMCCLIYLKLAEHILAGREKVEAYLLTQKEILAFWESMDFSPNEQKLFIRSMERDIRAMSYEELKSGGYVMESLEASLWCFLSFNNYSDTILGAINKGHDTDTTAAIVGGLAGLYYGKEGISEYWISSLARMEDIFDLADRLDKATSI